MDTMKLMTLGARWFAIYTRTLCKSTLGENGLAAERLVHVRVWRVSGTACNGVTTASLVESKERLQNREVSKCSIRTYERAKNNSN